MTMYVADDRHIKMTRGDTLSFGVELYDEDGDLLDQELETAYFTCRKNFTEALIFQKSLDDGITMQETGRYVVRVAPEDTASLDPGKYYYDLEISLNDDVFTILKGVLEIEHDITY